MLVSPTPISSWPCAAANTAVMSRHDVAHDADNHLPNDMHISETLEDSTRRAPSGWLLFCRSCI